MKNREMVLIEIQKNQYNNLILTGKLYREKFSSKISEAAYAKIISRLFKSGEIERVSQGVYCRPKKTRFGTVLPSEREIVEAFTGGNSGVVVGYGLYNSLGITTQISKRQNAYSRIAEEQLRQIGNVTIRKYEMEYTDDVKSTIQMMELLRHYRDIQDINITAWMRSIERLSAGYNEKTFEVVQKTIGYPKWTIAFLREVLEFYQIPNSLNKYLSALSDYPIPKMEVLYETSRKQSRI